MKTARFFAILLSGSCLWAGYQFTYSDGLTSIDPSKWAQTGSLSIGSNGVTGNGSLISTVAVPTGNDYDVRMTVHTASQGPCTGSYSLYARSTPNNSTAYALTIGSGSIGLFRVVANSWTALSWLPYSCSDGTVMRLVVRGGNITFWSGPYTATYQDASPIAAGQPGVGISSSSGDTIGSVQVGPIDYLPPSAINASAVETSTTANRVDLRWPAGAADANSAGLQGYVIYRDGVYLGSPTKPSWLDQTVTPGETTVYSIYAADQHGNVSAPAAVTVTVPGALGKSTAMPGAEALLGKPHPMVTYTGPTVDQREIGVRPNGTYWGGAGENIDLLSGNLNYSIPLIKSVSRDNWTVTFALSYNSQMWRESNGSAWLLGEDLGEGLGWTLQAGSILPIWYNGSVLYYRYSDSTGAQYALDTHNGSNVWTSSSDGVYVYFDANADVLHMTDGSFWNMNVISGSSEQDAGTQYPSQIEDSNGNELGVQYGGAVGEPYNYNTSSRILRIYDSRGGGGVSYSLTWVSQGSSPIPHLGFVTNSVGTGENYQLGYGFPSPLVDPFAGGNFGSTNVVLGAVLLSGLGVQYNLASDSSAQLLSATNLTGGTLSWSYSRNNYATRSYMEVASRTAQYAVNGTVYNFTITQDNSQTWHTSATVADQGAGAQKQWTFSGASDYTAGLVQTYAEQDNHSNTTFSKTYAWAQSSSSKPYVATLTSTLSPAASTTTTQQVDAYGNLTQQQVSDYSGSPTGTRTYNMTYTASNGNYAPLYIFNRLVTAAVSPGGTLSSNVYDGYCNGNGLTPTSATTNHDPNYTTSINYRGNPTSVSGLNGADPICTAYDTAGVAYYSSDANGHSVSIQTSSNSNYSLPSAILPGGKSNLQTQATYASSWAPATLTGPNGATGTTTYDSNGRPSQTTIPDGAVTTYTYTYYNSSTGANTQTATVDGRWQTTTLDGFGRTIQVQKGNGSTIVSTVQTQYAPCACSPLGKMSAVSQPYAPGATVYWTTYTYDASGRPLTVTAPDGHSTTTYIYTGNSTTVTDPAGSWKTSTVDAYGNVIQVTEPNPAGGTFATNYTYTPADQLTGVSMTRGNVTQTRTYLYSGSDLVSSTNPENGTVTYTYDQSHHVLSRTDALGWQTQYTYDSYARLTGVLYNGSQAVTYYYDNTNPSTGIQPPQQQNSLGRLSAVAFGGGTPYPYSHTAPGGNVTDAYADSYYYIYGYNAAGRVTTQDMAVVGGFYNAYNNITFSATYQWDDEGRMTSLQYPTVSAYGSFGNMPATMPTAGYQYDINGRLSEITMNNGNGPQELASGTYNAAGQLQTLWWGPGTETRTYNSLGQLTSQVLPYHLNMTYNYSATQNNGRISSSVDGITGESTSYTYDALNRLMAASNSLWSQSYTYDGFGNLLTKSLANGSPDPSPSLNLTYNANNQQNGLSYDANGNQLSLPSCGAECGNTYSAENRMVEQNLGYYSTSPVNIYTYDPWGKRVMSGTDSFGGPNGAPTPNYTYTFYGITGQPLATLNCNGSNYPAYPICAITGQNVYYGKKRIVAGGVPVVTDRLGTVRSDTQGDSYAYYPYGEERTSTVNGLYKFATYFRDTVGQDYADQRYYNAGVGRFWSPDRGGGITDDPGSMNKYAYVQGDPINFADPHGTEEVYVGGGLTLDCGDDADSIYDGTCVVADGGGGSEGCGGYADGFADNFLGWPAAPGCPVDYDGPPAPPQLTCGYTGNKTKNGSFNNVQVPGGSGNAFVDPISLMFQAGGGTGSYTFSVTQTVARSGTVDYSSGYVYTGPGTVGPDTLLPVESQQNGSKFTFSDVPGVWASMFGGTITAANFTATLQTTVTVTSGTQTVTCATVSWVATMSATTGKKGKLKINGRAKVTNVVQGGGQL